MPFRLYCADQVLFAENRSGEEPGGSFQVWAGPFPPWVLADQASETENKVLLGWSLSAGCMSLPFLAEVKEAWLFFSNPLSNPPIEKLLSVAKGD